MEKIRYSIVSYGRSVTELAGHIKFVLFDLWVQGSSRGH